MNWREVIDFILPRAGDPLQIGFLAIILTLMCSTMISAHWYARAASWEHKWNRGTPNDSSGDLDIEHGSVTDLWYAVATAPEKLAEIMPGLLLVIGLLGTFLGLGIALNHASNILGQPNALSASGATNSMQDLMSMMQGLGTKFKTSTWGITGFVLLKIWSELTRFEEKRLTWVIGKVKAELERRKREKSALDAANQDALFSQIYSAADRIICGFDENTTKLMELNKHAHMHALSHIDKNIKNIREDLGQLHVEARSGSVGISNAIAEAIEKLMDRNNALHELQLNYIDRGIKNIHEDIGQLHVESREGSDKIFSGITKNIAQLMENNKNLQELEFNHVDNLVRGISVELDCIKTETRGGSDKILNGIVRQITHLVDINKVLHEQELNHFDNSVEGIRKDIGQIYVETSAMNSAMAQFTESTQGAVENMAEAAQGMADGADKVGSAASDLVGAVGNFSSQFTEVLDNVRKDLGAAIHGLSSKASETLERGSTQLGEATRGISSALGVLSKDVKNTMGEVKNSINTALSIQQKAANEFTLSNQVLTENIATTTGIVEKLAKPIEAGLQSVSESGQHMRGIGKTLGISIKSMEGVVTKLVELTGALEPLRNFPSKPQFQSMLDPFAVLPVQQQDLLQELQYLRNDFKLYTDSELTKYMHGIEVVIDKPIQTIREIASKLVGLPGTLESLKTLPNLLQLQSMLNPLNELPSRQQAIIMELQGLRTDLKTYNNVSDIAGFESPSGY